MKKYFILAVLALSFTLNADAQKWNLSTNLIDWANLGTINIEAGVATSQHLSLMAGGKYNPWTFNEGDSQKQFQNRRISCYMGARVWPWHIYSGWWFAGQAQYEQYNRGGILDRFSEEGDAVGLGVSFGYTLMLHKSINMEFGAGLWGGYKWYTEYMCPICGRITDKGQTFFLNANEVKVSIMYVF